MSPRLFQLVINLYPPYIGAGVRVSEVAADWSAMTVSMKLRFYNRNYVGTHFGGNLFSMTDPFHMIMLMKRLGPGYRVWDQRAEIVFKKPGVGTVTTRMVIDEDQVDAIRSATVNGTKHFAEFDVSIVDEVGDIVAVVKKTLYVREKRPVSEAV